MSKYKVFKFSNVFTTIFSLEMFFSLFLMVGVFKESLNVGFDLTALFLILTVGAAIVRFIKSPVFLRSIKKPLLIFMIFFAIISISYYYTDSTIYSMEKLIKFFVLTTPAFLIPLLIFRTEESAKKFVKSTFLISFILAVFALKGILSGQQTDAGFFGFNDGNYLGLARALGMGSVILLIQVIFNKDSKKSFICLITLFGFLYTLMSTGGRMPLLSFGIIFFILMPFTIKFKRTKIIIHKGLKRLLMALTLFVITIFVMISKGYSPTSIKRILLLFNVQGGGESAMGRSVRYASSLEIWEQNPLFGVGVGSFPLHFNGVDGRDYPHNIFLEILSEFGLIGCIIFLILLLSGLYIGYKVTFRNNSGINLSYVSVFALGVYLFLNANTTGDINDNRMFFSFLAMLFMLKNYNLNYDSQKI